MEYRECELCKLRPASEIHHIIYRSHCKALIKSDINLIPLCQICHAKVHRGKESKELNHKLRLQFQNKLEILFDKEYLTEEEINDVLKISQKALKGLLKTLTVYKEGYEREDVIRACMGGKMYEWWFEGEIFMERKLKVLELFAGQRSIGKAFDKYNHEVFSVEWDKNITI